MDIQTLKAQIKEDASKIASMEALEEFRVKYLGRKGLLCELTASIPSLPQEERAGLGKEVNCLKSDLLDLISQKADEFKGGTDSDALMEVDLGLPGISQELGCLHPITKVMDDICAVFEKMGFSVCDGPEIETEFNNFTGLNIPLEHPSREAFDTFYLRTPPNAERLLLRSHTSPAQIRVMQQRNPPLAVVVPGRVYRPDAVDASHSFMFHQIEGFLVDEGINFSHLKGVLESFAKAIFGPQIKMRFRPHFFPFTEPSAEVDISCIICNGKGCSVCGRKGWLEVLGSGMIHPNVFRHVGYDPKKYSGFAFGMGVERLAMLKYGINDIRLFFENDLRFLRQF